MLRTLAAATLLLSSGSFVAPLTAGEPSPEAKQPTSILIPIAGLTAENADTLEPLLKLAGMDPEHCSQKTDDDGCAMKGKCSDGAGCEQVCPEARVASVETDVEKAHMRLVVAPKQELRLSQITAALDKSDFSVDTHKLVLTGDVVVSVEGLTCGGCASNVTKLMQKLEGAKTAKVAFGSKEESFLKLTAGADGLPYAQVLGALEQTKYFAGDVSWNGAAPKEKGGACCDAEKTEAQG